MLLVNLLKFPFIPLRASFRHLFNLLPVISLFVNVSDLFVKIRSMLEGDIDCLSDFARGHEDGADYFKISFTEQQEGKRIVFLAFDADKLLGYVHYNRFPQYSPFRRLNIPEIQDLYVAPEFGRHGVGADLVAACEGQADADNADQIGIGVGVGSEFGAAQRLYIRSGYMPDGAGVVFERGPVSVGEMRPVDDRLCLMLLKDLK